MKRKSESEGTSATAKDFSAAHARSRPDRGIEKRNSSLKKGWVTVLVATHNRADLIEGCIRSCLDQTYPKVNVVVVNDGSRDGTAAKLDELADIIGPERLKVIHKQKNEGPGCAYNCALQEITGEYFQFLDSDDRMSPHKIQKQIEALQDSGADAAVCGFRRVDAASGKQLSFDANSENIPQRLSRFRGINNAAPLIRTASLHPALRLDPDIDRFVDRDFFFRYFLTVRRWVYVAGIEVDYFQHGGSITAFNRNREVDFERYWRAARKYARSIHNDIPRNNLWMLSELGRNLALALCRAERYSSALVLVREAFGEARNGVGRMRCMLSFLRILAAGFRGNLKNEMFREKMYE